MLLPEPGALVSLALLKCFDGLMIVVMTRSISGSSGAVPAFARVCECVCVGGDTLMSCFILSILQFV